MTSEPIHRRAHGGDRLRYLTDGVFAIVMTLLVLELPRPEGDDVGHDIIHALPKIAVYVLTIAVLGGMWFRNRTESEFVARSNHTYSWLTFAWLAVVALLPWSASLMMEHPRSTPAVATFTINAMLAAAIQQGTWWYATGPRGLVDDLPVRVRRASRLVGWIPVIDFGIALIVSTFSPLSALILNLLAPLAYISGVLYRLLARLSREPTPTPGS